MYLRKISLLSRICALFVTVTLLAGCAGGGGISLKAGAPEFSNPEHTYTPPPVLMPEYVGTIQEVRDDGDRSGLIDMSNVSKGYIAASCKAGTNAVLKVESAGNAYNYFLSNDGEYNFYPLAMGNGTYTFTLLIQLAGSEYEVFVTAQSSVSLENEQLPFLVPNKIVNYTASSQAVSFSHDLAAHASSQLEVVQQVYYWVATNITYDTEKAETIQSTQGYLPDVDKILAEKKGICYDYAALVAAMLRANGIPCQLIMGDVDNGSGGTVYHAWNMIWLEDEGEIVVKMPTTPEEWQRLDLTFAASGDSSITQFVGDANNYVPMSTH